MKGVDVGFRQAAFAPCDLGEIGVGKHDPVEIIRRMRCLSREPLKVLLSAV